MDSENVKHHLSQIETHWTAVFQAHQGRSAEAAEAQAELVLRYGGAVHRYLLASLRDVDAADELSQEFALRFLRGDFKNADPGKGRFRDFLEAIDLPLDGRLPPRPSSTAAVSGPRARAGCRLPMRGTVSSTASSSRAGANS